MVVSCRVVLISIMDLSYYFIPIVWTDFSLRNQLVNFIFDNLSDFFLICVMSKDYGSILTSLVISLSVHCSRVMESIEEFHKFLVRYFVSIEFNMSHFNVTSLSSANLFVSGIWSSVRVCAHKSNWCSKNWVGVLLSKCSCKKLLCAPVASSTESSKFFTILWIMFPTFRTSIVPVDVPWLWATTKTSKEA